jgi:D-3-phosphoglycerate dehydrogenase / 2-oxoglutarate reductase
VALTTLILDPIWPNAARLFAEHGIEVFQAEQESRATRVDFVILRSGVTLAAQRLDPLKDRGLRAVLRAGSGLDNIDVAYCRANGIDVVNFPGANAESVAEVTLSYMLSGVHRLYPAHHELQAGVFAKSKYLGRNLASATVAFIGHGATARATISLLRKMGVEDIWVNRRSSAQADRNDNPHGVRFTDLAASFQADIVSLHVPLNDSTRFLVNDALLRQAKEGLFLINIARRDVVDHDAVARHLDRGQLSGYASDVLDPVLDRRLLDRGDVFATPHLGAQSVDCQRVIAHALLDYMLTRKTGS